MNIFYLDSDPRAAARMLADKHIVKMGLESVQMLCTAHRVLDGDAVISDDLYKICHVNHRCNRWIRTSSSNYTWLLHHASEIFKIYTAKAKKHHKSESYIDILNHLPSNLQEGSLTPPALAMPDEFKVSSDPIKCYREYYRIDKIRLHKWTYNETPNWVYSSTG